ncbi:MAG: periplasmic heavy metal sensor [Hyphomicrobiaceae bacterium]
MTSTDGGSRAGPDPDQGPAAPQAPKRRAPRWMIVMLVLSVGLNLLVVGAAAGLAWRFRQMSPEFGMWPSSRPMHAEHGDSLRQRFRERREAFRAQSEAVFEARRELRAILELPDFDEARFSAAQENVIAATIDLRRAQADALKSIVRELSPDERKRLSKYLEPRYRRWSRERE